MFKSYILLTTYFLIYLFVITVSSSEGEDLIKFIDIQSIMTTEYPEYKLDCDQVWIRNVPIYMENFPSTHSEYGKTYFYKNEKGKFLFIKIAFFNESVKAKSEINNNTPIPLSKISDDLGEFSMSDKNEARNHIQFQRKNVNINLMSNENYGLLLNMAKKIDGAIVDSRKYVTMGSANVFEMTSEKIVTEKKKETKFAPSCLKSQSLQYIIAASSSNAVVSTVTDPVEVKYVPIQEGRDVLWLIGKYKNDEIRCVSYEITVSQSKERKNKLTSLLKQIDNPSSLKSKYDSLIAILDIVEKGDDECLPTITMLLQHNQPIIYRQYAIRIIGIIRNEKSVNNLLQLITESNRTEINDINDEAATIIRESLLSLEMINPDIAIQASEQIIRNLNMHPDLKDFAGGVRRRNKMKN